jgi:hypothetical protein
MKLLRSLFLLLILVTVVAGCERIKTTYAGVKESDKPSGLPVTEGTIDPHRK